MLCTRSYDSWPLHGFVTLGKGLSPPESQEFDRTAGLCGIQEKKVSFSGSGTNRLWYADARRKARKEIVDNTDKGVPRATPLSTEQITQRNILRVLLAGFALVILLLVVAGIVGVRNTSSIQANAAKLVEEQGETTVLVEEMQREQAALSTVFYNLALGPRSIDREKVLAQLNTVNENIDQMVSKTENTPEESLGKELSQVALAFSVEAKRLLALNNVPTRLSHDLFQRHKMVLGIVGKLITTNQLRAQAAQQGIDQQSRKLVTQAFVLLAACLVLALLFAVGTVRLATGLLRKRE